jgi:deoxyribodipyrimidine photo-lyase
VSEALATSDRTLRGIGSPYAVTPGAVLKPDGSPYAVFTPFSRRWREIGWAAPVPEPDVRWAGSGPQGVAGDPWPERPDPGCELPPAGERAALESWTRFLTSGSAADGSGRAAVDAYGDLRDRPGLAATSRMSPHLKWGTIHPRTLLADLDPSGAGPRGHTKYSSELAWREFYADVLFRRPESAWWNLDRRMDAMPIDTDAAARERFRRWCAGRTGFGMVDAGMAELAATGWMHNRARMVVASFLVKDLHLPWQWGARHFLEHLVDGDLASNNHGWQWTAGTGTDAAPYFRIFNPATQQERYDPDGEYVARWVRDPAPPMLDHAAERDEALRRLAGLKTGR